MSERRCEYARSGLCDEADPEKLLPVWTVAVWSKQSAGPIWNPTPTYYCERHRPIEDHFTSWKDPYATL